MLRYSIKTLYERVEGLHKQTYIHNEVPVREGGRYGIRTSKTAYMACCMDDLHGRKIRPLRYYSGM